MPSRSIGTTLLAAGLLAALAGPRAVGLGPTEFVAPADTTDAVTIPWLEAVTMEPIRVVVHHDARLEAVTMEPIRVLIPSADSATTESPEASPRR